MFMLAKTFFVSVFIFAGSIVLALPLSQMSVAPNRAEALSPVPTQTPHAEETAVSVSVSQTEMRTTQQEKPKPVVPTRFETPVRVRIPSIDLDTRIIPLGLNSKGEMDVPDGDTNDVGWYKNGPKPGEIGSAVLDAHVYAAFENLKYVPVGAEIIVEGNDGKTLRFVVEDSRVYKLSELSPDLLFNRKDARRLNLITCAGKPTGDTYSHRLVVYATFVEAL